MWLLWVHLCSMPSRENVLCEQSFLGTNTAERKRSRSAAQQKRKTDRVRSAALTRRRGDIRAKCDTFRGKLGRSSTGIGRWRKPRRRKKTPIRLCLGFLGWQMFLWMCCGLPVTFPSGCRFRACRKSAKHELSREEAALACRRSLCQTPDGNF